MCRSIGEDYEPGDVFGIQAYELTCHKARQSLA
jgi:hypothetical protein